MSFVCLYKRIARGVCELSRREIYILCICRDECMEWKRRCHPVREFFGIPLVQVPITYVVRVASKRYQLNFFCDFISVHE